MLKDDCSTPLDPATASDVKIGSAPNYEIIVDETKPNGFEHSVCYECEFTCYKIKMQKILTLKVVPPDCSNSLTAIPFSPLTVQYNNAGSK